MELQPVGVTVREGPSQVRSQLRGFNCLVERFHGSHNVHLGEAQTKSLSPQWKKIHKSDFLEYISF